ncbi:MAG: DUF1801 domain-containing protein [Salibacteraceae bacterium]
MNQNKQVTEYINNSPSQIDVLQELRRIIHYVIPNVKEDIKWGIPVFTKTKIFTYLRASKNHVSIGFYNLNKIEDSNGLLEGSGKTMKHLKIKKVSDIDEALISNWLKATAE